MDLGELRGGNKGEYNENTYGSISLPSEYNENTYYWMYIIT